MNSPNIICDTDTIKSAVVGDKIYSVDKQYNFNSVFDTKTGFYMRSGIIENNVDDSTLCTCCSYKLLPSTMWK